LDNASAAFIHSLDRGVLLVEPRALNVSLLLGVKFLVIDLAHQVGNNFGPLFLHSAHVGAGQVFGGFFELSDRLSGARGNARTVVITVFGLEVTAVVRGLVLRDDGAEARLGTAYGAIDKRKLSDVVLVNHAQNGLLLVNVDLRVAVLMLVRGLELTETVVGDQAGGLLLGLAVEGAQGSRNASGAETTDVSFLFTFLKSK
jgi:hypothetical protein